MYDFLHQWETVLMDGNADKTEAMGIKTEGRLVLTNERLIFINSLSGDIEYINTNDILGDIKDFNMSSSSKNVIKVMTKQGKTFEFFVVEKEGWINAFSMVESYTVNNTNNVQANALLEKNMSDSNEDVEVGNNTTDLNSKSQNNKLNWIVCLIVSAIVILCTVFYLVGTNNNENSEDTDFNENSKKPDFGITLDEYIDNIKEYAVEYVGTEENSEGGINYIYSYGESKLWVYTRKNGYVYQVAYNDSNFEYGVGQISDLTVSLSAIFFAGTGVEESQSQLYSGVKQCINGGSGSSMTYDDCIVYYSNAILPYYETAWIEARGVGNSKNVSESVNNTDEINNTDENSNVDGKEDNSDVYSFISIDKKARFGATFKITFEEVVEALNKYNFFSTDICVDDFLSSAIKDGKGNIIIYTYTANDIDGIALYEDEGSGYICFGDYLVSMDAVEYGKTDFDEVISKASVLMEILTGGYSDSLGNQDICKWICKEKNSPIEENGRIFTTDYDKGVVLQCFNGKMPNVEGKSFESLLKKMQNVEHYAIYSMNLLNYEEWKENQWIDKEDKSNQITELGKLSEIEDVSSIMDVKTKAQKFRVNFDNHTFSMKAELKDNDWLDIEKDAMLLDENIVVKQSREKDGENILYIISIYAFKDYYFECYWKYPVYVLEITFCCEDDRLYQYDIENNSDLKNFIYRIVDAVKEETPLDEKNMAVSLTDWSQYEWLFYCLECQEEYSDSNRILLDGEIFEMTVEGFSTGHYSEYSEVYLEAEDIIFQEDDVIVIDTSNNWDNPQKIYFYKMGNKKPEYYDNGNPESGMYAFPEYCLEIKMKRKTNDEYNKKLTELPEFMDLIKEIAKKLTTP